MFHVVKPLMPILCVCEKTRIHNSEHVNFPLIYLKIKLVDALVCPWCPRGRFEHATRITDLTRFVFIHFVGASDLHLRTVQRRHICYGCTPEFYKKMNSFLLEFSGSVIQAGLLHCFTICFVSVIAHCVHQSRLKYIVEHYLSICVITYLMKGKIMKCGFYSIYLPID